MGLRLKAHPHLQNLILANVAMILNHHRLCRIQDRAQVHPQHTLNLIQLYQATDQIGAFQKRVIRPLAQVLFASLHQPSFWTMLGDWVLAQLEFWDTQASPPDVCLTIGLLPLLTSANDPDPFSWEETIVVQAMALEAAHQLVDSLPIASLEADGLESLLGLTNTLIEDSSAFDPNSFEPIALGMPIIPTALCEGESGPTLDAGTAQAIRRLPSLSFTISRQGPLKIPVQQVLSQWVWEVTQRFGTEVGYVGLLLAEQAAMMTPPWQGSISIVGQDMIQRLHWQTRPKLSHQLKKLARLVQLLCHSQVAVEERDLGHRLTMSSRSLLWQLDQVMVERQLQFKDQGARGLSPESYGVGNTHSVTVRFSPGAWIQGFTRVYGSEVYEHLLDYSRLARQILSIDPNLSRLAAKLAIFLAYHSGLETQQVWSVGDLLRAMELPGHSQALGGHSMRRQQVFQDWNQVLTIFKGLGWQLMFDPSSYPMAIRPSWAQTDSETLGTEFTGDWLKAIITITPITLSTTTKLPIKRQPGSTRSSYRQRQPRRQTAKIPCEVLEQALAAKGMSQAKLARSLNLDRSTINRWINGSRPIHARYRPLLWDLLGDELKQVSS